MKLSISPKIAVKFYNVHKLYFLMPGSQIACFAIIGLGHCVTNVITVCMLICKCMYADVNKINDS